MIPFDKNTAVTLWKKKKNTSKVSFWAVLRCEQTKIVDNCFCRSECAETRSNGSEACLTSSMTMFQEERTREPRRLLAGGRPYPPNRNKKAPDCCPSFFWSGITLSIFVLVQKYSPSLQRQTTAKLLCLQFCWGLIVALVRREPRPSKTKSRPRGSTFSFGAYYVAR